MRFYHLADLHMGKKVNGFSMLDDQAYALEGLLAIIDRDPKPVDALVLAGDLYDRRNPGPDAMALLDDFLSQVILDRGIPVLAIGGNHDSGDRLDFGQGLLARAGYHLAGSLQLPLTQVRLQDAWGPVVFTLLPFADKARLRHLFQTEEGSYSDLMAMALDQADLDAQARHVLVAHGVVSAADLDRSDSERELFIGGTDFWTSPRLQAFDYIALGHLHKAQSAGRDAAYYAGSLCKYSFSEENHTKQALAVDMDGQGQVSLERIPIPQVRDMVTLTGTLADLEAAEPPFDAHRQDYVRAVLTDSGAILEPMARLRDVYPYIMILERETKASASPRAHRLAISQAKSPLAYFQDFHQHVTGQEADPQAQAYMEALWETVKEEANS